jgi:hypothetical protein
MSWAATPASRTRIPGEVILRQAGNGQSSEQILAAFFAKCAQLSRQMQVTAGAPNFGDLSLASGIGRIVLHANYCARQLPKEVMC